MKVNRETNCYCICHNSFSSRASCNHCGGKVLIRKQRAEELDQLISVGMFGKNTEDLDLGEAMKYIKVSDKIPMDLLLDYIENIEKKAFDRFDKDMRDWVDFNKHNLGEFGEFIRTEYVYNKLMMMKEKLEFTYKDRG